MECGIVLEPEIERLLQENQKDYDVIVHESILDSSAEIDLKERELALLRKSIEEYRIKREAQIHRIQVLERLIDDRSKSLHVMEKQAGSLKCQLSHDIDAKEREYRAISRSVEERGIELEVMEEALKSVRKQIGECERSFRVKEEDCNWKLEKMQQLISEHDGVHKKMQRAIEACGVDLGAKESRLSEVEGLIREREQVLHNIHRDFEWKEEELREVSVRIADCNKELRAREEELDSMQRLIDGEGKELEFKRRNLLNSMQAKIIQLVKELESNTKEFDSFRRSMREKSAELEKKEKKLGQGLKDLESMKKQFEGRVKEFESIEKQYGGGGHEKELKAKERKFEERVEEFESKEKHFESKERQFEGQAKELKYKEEQFIGRVKEFELKEVQLEGQLLELKSKQKQFEAQVKELELKEVQFRLAMKKLESEERKFEGRLKDLQSKENQWGRQQLKELQLKEKRCESLRKSCEEGQVLKDKSNILLHQVKAEPQDFRDANSANICKKLQLLFNLLKNYELVCSQVSDALQTSADPSIMVLATIKGFCSPQLRQELSECDAIITRRIRNLLMDELKKSSPVISSHVKQEAMQFAIDWKASITVADTNCLEVLDFLKFIATYEIGYSFNPNELQSLLDIISQHCQSPQALGNIEELPDNQICPTTADGRNLQLLSDEPELIGNDILACLQTSIDPATLVFNIIQNHLAQQNRKENEGVIIDGSHIILLDRLMRISPPFVKPNIRDAAKKLAIALKAKLNPSDENSSVVLGFLLLLSVYRLVSFFNEDEVFKLFEFVVHHKQAVELFRTLGFADKISDFVQLLIAKKQYIEAVRFIGAYNLSDKIDPVGLLRLVKVKAARLPSKSGRKKRFEKKVWCKDMEIRILENILQCISDNNLGYQDLVNEIQDRLLFVKTLKEELIAEERKKEELGRLVSKLSATLEVHQQSEEEKCANGAVTMNQVKVQQLEAKKAANGAVTINQVKVQQLEAEALKPADGKISMNQVEVQHPEENTSTTEEAVTVSQVQVQQPQEKKRPIEAAPDNHQLHQSAGHNIKRPRTGASHSLPPHVSSPQYQHNFRPSGMPAQFGFPPHYGYPRPYPPSR